MGTLSKKKHFNELLKVITESIYGSVLHICEGD